MGRLIFQTEVLQGLRFWNTIFIETLMSIQQGISLERNLDMIGRVVEVMIDGTGEEDEVEYFIARTSGHAPEVDGSVFIEKGKEPAVPGDFRNVRITEADEYDLFGEFV